MFIPGEIWEKHIYGSLKGGIPLDFNVKNSTYTPIQKFSKPIENQNTPTKKTEQPLKADNSVLENIINTVSHKVEIFMEKSLQLKQDTQNTLRELGFDKKESTSITNQIISSEDSAKTIKELPQIISNLKKAGLTKDQIKSLISTLSSNTNDAINNSLLSLSNALESLMGNTYEVPIKTNNLIEMLEAKTKEAKGPKFSSEQIYEILVNIPENSEELTPGTYNKIDEAIEFFVKLNDGYPLEDQLNSDDMFYLINDIINYTKSNTDSVFDTLQESANILRRHGINTPSAVSTALSDIVIEAGQCSDSVLENIDQIMSTSQAVKYDLESNHQQNIDIFVDSDIFFGVNPYRASDKGLKEIFTNRLKQRYELIPEDKRPTAVVIYPKADNTGGFESNSDSKMIDDLITQGYKVMYHEIAGDEEMIDAIKNSATPENKASLLVIGGHGSKDMISFSEADPRKESISEESKVLDRSDKQQIADSGVVDLLEKDAQIALFSCNTNEGGDGADNMKNFISNLFNKEVFAPKISTSKQKMHFDNNHRITDISWK